MGWTKASAVDMAKNIILKDATDEMLTQSKKMISIASAPNRRTSSYAFTNCIVQIKIMVPLNDSKTADLVAQRIVKLFHNTLVNGRLVTLDAALGEYTAPAGLYCHAVRFFYYSHI